MNLQNIDLLSVGVAIAGMLIMSFAVLFNNLKSASNRLFFALSVTASVWGTVNYLSYQPSTPELSFWLLRSVMFFGVWSSFFTYTFAYVFPLETAVFSLFYKRFILPLTAVTAVVTLTPLVFSGISKVGDGQVTGVVNGPGIFLYALTTVLLNLGAVVILVKKIKRADKALRRPLELILFGIYIMLFLIIGGNLILPAFMNNTRLIPLGALFMLPFIAFTSYAIMKHKLFNVRVAGSAALVFALAVVAFFEVVLSRSLGLILYRSLIFLLVLAFGTLLIRGVLREVEQREQLQKLTGQLRQVNVDLMVRNRYLAALQSLTGEITRSLNFKKFAQDIVDGVATKLGFAGGVLFLMKKEKLEIAAATHSRLFAKALGYLPQPLFSYSGSLSDNNLTVLAIRTGRIQIGSDLHAFISPPLPKGLSLILQNALRVRSIMAVPILSESRVLGCLVVAGRATRENTSNNEIQMVKALADEVGIVTRNLTLYEQLEEANNRLVHANEELSRLDKAKTEFLSIASHQLRTPLTAIKGYISMILDKDYGRYPARLETPLKDVFESAQRLIILVNDLLDVSRIASGRLELSLQAVDLNKLAAEVIEEIKPKADGKGVDLVVQSALPLGTAVRADEEKLRQVVINLIDNAIKYTAKGLVKVIIEKDGFRVRCTVADSGIGLTPEEIPQLFHRFMRTNEAKLVETEGTGLGLYVAKTIIESLNGKIWVESEGLGKGSKFIFELPQAPSGFKGGQVIKAEPHENIA